MLLCANLSAVHVVYPDLSASLFLCAFVVSFCALRSLCIVFVGIGCT